MKIDKPKYAGLDGLTIIATYLVQVSLVVAAILSWYEGEYIIIFLAGLTFLLSLVPEVVKRRYNVTLPSGFQLAVVLFIYAAIFLGELVFYKHVWWWDKLLHTLSGVGLGLIGFAIIYYIYRLRRFTASPFLIAIFSFTFAVTFGVLWELFEFMMDNNFGTNMMRSGLHDTMWDLVVDSVGALLASIAAYTYVKHKEKKGVIKSLMKKFIHHNPQFK